jgi:hypothetical protein
MSLAATDMFTIAYGVVSLYLDSLEVSILDLLFLKGQPQMTFGRKRLNMPDFNRSDIEGYKNRDGTYFVILPSTHDLFNLSSGWGTNFLTESSSGIEHTSDITLIVLISDAAQSEISFNFITGHRKVNSIPGAFPVRYRVHSVSLYRMHGSVWIFCFETS